MGFTACVVLLSNLFAQNIYFMSSLFLGLTLTSLPFIVIAERNSLQGHFHNILFALLGTGLVIGLTFLRTGSGTLGHVDYAQLQPLQMAYLFASGAVAITAMVLPGISGSSILLIAGVYLPTLQAIHSFLNLQFDVIPGLLALGLGILTGVAMSIHAIHNALRKYRSQTVWLILGLMLGSLYAIAEGPASLDIPMAPLSAATFELPAFVLGSAILLGLEILRKVSEKRSFNTQTHRKETVCHES